MKKISIVLFAIVLLLALSMNAFAATMAGVDINVSLVNQNPDPARAGDVLEVRIGVENQGTSAVENMVLEVNPSFPFELAPGQVAATNVGTLNAYQTGSNMKIIKYQLMVDKDAVAGDYELNVLQYKEGEKSAAYIERTLIVDIESSDNAEIIYIDKVKLIPGEITPLTFTINNVGSAPLRDLTFSWSNEDDVVLPVGSDDTKYIKYIEVGDSVDLTYNVIASTDADPGLYKLDLSLAYDNPSTGEQNQISTNAGVFVGGGTDFDVTFSESSAGTTSFSIANIGSTPAYSVSVRVPQQQGWTVRGSNSAIIGNLNKGDYTVVSFTLQNNAQSAMNASGMGQRPGFGMQNRTSNMSASRSGGILLEISYTDTMNQRTVLTKEVDMSTATSGTSVTTTGASQQFGPRASTNNHLTRNVIIWVAIVGGAVAGILIYRRHRKNAKRRKMLKE